MINDINVQKATAGFCFLYHLEVGDAQATVQLDQNTRLVQARGPRNGERGHQLGA